jgi:hypothetical protein
MRQLQEPWDGSFHWLLFCGLWIQVRSPRMKRGVKKRGDAMKLEVIGKDGKVKMHTEHPECVPPSENLMQLVLKGYTVKVDGKRWKIGQEIGGENKKPADKRKGRLSAGKGG